MKIMSFLRPSREASSERAARQDEPKNRARVEFSEAVVQLSRRTSDVTKIANDAIASMHRGKGN